MNHYLHLDKMKHLSALQVQDLIEKKDTSAPNSFYLLDVRTKGEFARRRIKTAVNIPLDELVHRTGEIPKEKMIVTICEHGFRSQTAAGILQRVGFEDVFNMMGGMSQWRGMAISDEVRS
ncbi:MAG: rhodanese-like domain-containing protein [Chloroherpetonaceae bacterium]|nr:rhodanese-like domain-containing protein [Chloroherpetonaceae bacterium]